MNAGLIPLRKLAERAGVTTQCLKRRLQKYDARLGGKLLFRFGDPRWGHVYADVAALKRYLPALGNQVAVDDPAVETLKRLEAVDDRLRHLQEEFAFVREILLASAA